MNSALNFAVGLEQVADKYRAAERSHLLAATRDTKQPEARERQPRTSRVWLGLRRRPKVA
jgi:hypothetical protein